MENFYLGSKLVQAWPAVRITTREGKFEYAEIGDVVDPNAQKVEEGYRVQYDDGYRSWSPKTVFERSYRPTTGLNFGLAIEAAKMGKKISRVGWSGRGMYVFLAQGDSIEFTTDADMSEFVDKEFKVADMLVLRTAQGNLQPGWLATQGDMLADDWCIVE